jgi:hypothetical protein
MKRIYIGIDNGLTGGIVAISESGSILESTVMPTRGKAKGNEVDPLAIWHWICDLDEPTQNLCAVLETPGKHSPGAMALCSMWDSYGSIRSLLETRSIRHHRIAPQKWQRAMLIGCAKGDTKPAALIKARQLWPNETWLKSSRCTKPHDGMIDAALIAEFGRMNNY